MIRTFGLNIYPCNLATPFFRATSAPVPHTTCKLVESLMSRYETHSYEPEREECNGCD